jgi:hypothetical protein
MGPEEGTKARKQNKYHKYSWRTYSWRKLELQSTTVPENTNQEQSTPKFNSAMVKKKQMSL